MSVGEAVGAARARYDGLDARGRLGVWIAALVPFLALPLVVRSALPNRSFFLLNTFVFAFLFLTTGHAWNIVGGYAGQVSLGHAVMFAAGAYGTAVLFVDYGLTPVVGILVGGLLAAAVGLSIGAVTFRLRYHYFAMATLAAALIVRVVFMRWEFVGGATGIEYPIDRVGTLYSLTFGDKLPYYYLTGAVALATTLFVRRLDRSKLGTYLKAINMDQELAESAGLPAWRYKMYAMGLSSFLTGIGGGLYANYVLYIDPLSTLRVLRNIDIIMVPIIGGVGTVFGPVVGAFVFVPVREYTRSALSGSATGLGWVLFGVVLLLISVYRPGGLLGGYTGRWGE